MQLKPAPLVLIMLMCITRTLAQSTDSIISEQKINNVWQKTSLLIVTNDNQCRAKGSVSKNWDATLHKWVNVQRHTVKYNLSGKIMESTTQYWDNTHQQWKDQRLNTYSYSKDGLSSGYSVAYWDSTLKSWTYFAKYTDSFNSVGSKIYSSLEWLTDNIWQPKTRDFYRYNKNNQLIYWQGDNWQNNAWIDNHKTEYQYSSDGLQNSSMYSIWNPVTQIWNKLSRQQSDLIGGTMLPKKNNFTRLLF